MGKYFGTDGIRGKYGDNLNAGLAYMAGVALAVYFGGGDFYVGRDTRLSGIQIESALCDGISSGGGNAVKAGIIPTPGIAYLARKHKGAAGIMVSASHNPPEYNGIKIFDSLGVKLNEEAEGSVEYYIDNLPASTKTRGAVTVLDGAAEDYTDYLVAAADIKFDGLKVALDCGWGAASNYAPEVFRRLGANPVTVNCSETDGGKINAGCGAAHGEFIEKFSKLQNCALGFSFDGDADRLAVAYNGKAVDGDSVLYNISRVVPLNGNVVVGTVLTNFALEKILEKEGKRLIRTPVGDKYICDLMFKKDYRLGGEQSGHYIVYPAATTGDGILSASYFTKSLLGGKTLSKPVILDLVPQKAIAEPADPSIMYDKTLIEMIDEYSEKLKRGGRIIVRMSGTEPKVRVMVEHSDAAVVDDTLAVFKRYINSLSF